MSFAHKWAACALVSLLPVAALGQNTNAAAQRQAREQWFLRGRIGTPAAARTRALRQRALAGSRPVTAAVSTNDGWTPVGPLPLASDPTGLGERDYGWVAGRVTSIAVDLNDQTGNTVYAGGAFGGVWKSTNAGPSSPAAANVTWQPLTDDQETLATFPEIIYAGTDGFGPLRATGSIGGHVWVSDPSDPSVWFDRTGTINPDHFPVSAIAIDPFDSETDPTGKTGGRAAYVALTGYGTGSHVWKTVNAGVTWMHFDGFAPNALPDVPANAPIVDSNAMGGSVYVGTDQGVYVSKTNDPNGTSWLPVGRGIGGKLPNVPVTALQIFNDGATKLLWAATYGRGVWQFVLATTPDFQVSVAAPSQTVLAGQTAHFAGKLSALNGYSSGVALSCVVVSNPPPSVCTPIPGQIPSVDGATFDLAASGPLGDYAFKVHALGL